MAKKATAKSKKKVEGFTISHEILIKAPAKKVYSAFTTKLGLELWWTNKVEIDSVIGGIAEFEFKNNYKKKMLIKKLDQNRLTEWKCVEGEDEWIDTAIIFKNHPDGMATRLVFEHTNWKKKTALFKECTEHWLKYLESLKSYCETGTGAPASS